MRNALEIIRKNSPQLFFVALRVSGRSTPGLFALLITNFKGVFSEISSECWENWIFWFLVTTLIVFVCNFKVGILSFLWNTDWQIDHKIDRLNHTLANDSLAGDTLARVTLWPVFLASFGMLPLGYQRVNKNSIIATVHWEELLQCFRFNFQQTLRIQIQGCQGCQKTRNFMRTSKILIARSTIQPKLSRIKKILRNSSKFLKKWQIVFDFTQFWLDGRPGNEYF